MNSVAIIVDDGMAEWAPAAVAAAASVVAVVADFGTKPARSYCSWACRGRRAATRDFGDEMSCVILHRPVDWAVSNCWRNSAEIENKKRRNSFYISEVW